MAKIKDPKGAVAERVLRKRIGGHIVEEVQHLIEKPRGIVEVALRDVDSYKLKHYEKKENFISPLWTLTARSYQRYAFGQFPLNEQPRVDWPGSGTAGRPTVQFPNNHIAAWMDLNPEDNTDIHLIPDGNGIVAYASKLPVGSPVQSRGVVNTAETEWRENGEYGVYDWSSAAGNGTFQSVGYICCQPGTGVTTGVPLGRISPTDRRYFTIQGTTYDHFGLSSSDSPTTGTPGKNFARDIIVPVRLDNWFTSSWALVTIPYSQWNSGLSWDDYGACLIPVDSASVLNITLPVSTDSCCFLGEISGYYWVSFRNNGSYSYIARVDKTSGAVDKMVTVLAGSVNGVSYHYLTGECIGTDLFIADAYGFDSPIYRYDTTTTLPTLTATITPQWPTARVGSGGISSLISNGFDLIAYHGKAGVIMLDTSGNRKAWFGYFGSGASELGSNPYSATYAISGLSVIEGFYSYRQTSSLPSSYGGNPSHAYSGASPTSSALLWVDGTLYTFGGMANSGTESVLASISPFGNNLGTRVVLDAPVTKSSSSTMKISYEIEFPAYLGA